MGAGPAAVAAGWACFDTPVGLCALAWDAQGRLTCTPNGSAMIGFAVAYCYQSAGARHGHCCHPHSPGP
jgi:hypothetical protein